MQNHSLFSGSYFLELINRLIFFIQSKSEKLIEQSLFFQHLDNLIFVIICSVFVVSTFASSDSIGYLALMVIFLNFLKVIFKKGEQIELTLFDYFVVLFFALVTISLAGSTQFHLSLKGFLKTFTYVGFYFSSVQYFKSNLKKIPYLLLIILVCTLGESIIGLYQNFGQVEEISTWQDVSNINPEDVMTRVYGTLLPLNPNLFGGYLLAIIPSVLGCGMLGLLRKNNVIAVISFLVLALASLILLFTGCRGAYFAYAVVFLGIFVLAAKFIWKDLAKNKAFFKKLYLVIVGSLCLISSAVILFVSSIRTRVLSIFAMRGDSSTSFRMNVYHSAIQMAKDNWLFGIGLGNQNFREIYGLYMKTGFDALSAYNIFLEISVESGVFALILFICFLIFFFMESIKFLFESKNYESQIIVAVSLLTVLGMIVHGFVDTVFFRPQIQFIFWLMISFASAILLNQNELKD